jgi:hypothetical protein
MKAFYVFMSFLMLVVVIGFLMFISNRVDQREAMIQPPPSIDIRETEQELPQVLPPVIHNNTTHETRVIEKEKLVPMPEKTMDVPDTTVHDDAAAAN